MHRKDQWAEGEKMGWEGNGVSEISNIVNQLLIMAFRITKSQILRRFNPKIKVHITLSTLYWLLQDTYTSRI